MTAKQKVLQVAHTAAKHFPCCGEPALVVQPVVIDNVILVLFDV
jgi:hypothetical protein